MLPLWRTPFHVGKLGGEVGLLFCPCIHFVYAVKLCNLVYMPALA